MSSGDPVPISSGVMSSKPKKSNDAKRTPQQEATLKHTRQFLKADKITHTHTPEAHGIYNHIGLDNSFNMEKFRKEFKVKINTNTDLEMNFEMIGIDIPLANTFRRILIAEIPTMCIENVYVINNTSIIPDEVLAHRIGLIPLKADPRKFTELPKGAGDDAYDVLNTLVFSLSVTCTAIPGAQESDPEHLKYKNSRVYSSDLVWEPAAEDQLEKLGISDPIETVHKDILIAKLRPGQTIELKCYAHKGIGKDHAKFSPVATASYRLLPEISINEKITGDLAKELVETCPMGVFELKETREGPIAAVIESKKATMCRACIQHPTFGDKISLQQIKNHFIFSVESTGILPASVLVEEAFRVFLMKLQQIKEAFELARSPLEPDGSNTATK